MQNHPVIPVRLFCGRNYVVFNAHWHTPCRHRSHVWRQHRTVHIIDKSAATSFCRCSRHQFKEFQIYWQYFLEEDIFFVSISLIKFRILEHSVLGNPVLMISESITMIQSALINLDFSNLEYSHSSLIFLKPFVFLSILHVLPHHFCSLVRILIFLTMDFYIWNYLYHLQ